MTTTNDTSTTTRRGRGRRCINAMVDDVAHVSVQTAAELARATWGPMSLYPGDLEAVLPAVAAIEEWATANGSPNLRDLDADKLLRQLAGVTTLTGKLSVKKRDRLHFLRNTLSAMRGTVLYHATTGRKRSDRPANDSLDAGLPALPARTGLARRPLTDDEVLLGNILVEIDLLESAPMLPINAYLIGSAGVHTMESSDVSTDHLDHRTEPTSITAKGLWGWTGRDVPLDAFARNALARTLADTPAGTQRLTYTGGNPGTKEASASLSPVLSRFLRRAGIADPNVTAKSLSVTRPYRILRQDNDFKTAKKVHGGKSNNLLVDINCTLDETTLHKGKIGILDHTGRTVAKVKARHIATMPKGK